MSGSGGELLGALVADRYRLVERVAVGGMGEVWRADDLLLGRVVALKMLKPEYLADDEFRARFRAEARHAGRISHPGIASVYDFGESDDSAWLVMELVEGEPLSRVLRREGRLSVDRTLDVVAQAAAALHAAHEGGVVHRDVKPGNLLVRHDGVLKVTDFGIASAADAVPLTRTGHVVGTAYYLSPEQASGRSGTPASDLYALGVVAYECLTGARPFDAESAVAVALAHVRDTPPSLPASVPAPVRDLVTQLLAKAPEDRFADAAALAHAAQELRGSLSEDGYGDPDADARADTELLALPVPPGRSRSSRRWPRRGLQVAAGLVAVLGLALGLRAADPAPVLEPVAEPAPAVASATPSAAPSVVPSVTPSPEPERVVLDAAAYLGKPAAQVRAELADQGLVPRLAYDGSGTPVGTVSGVQPTGPVAVGTAVVLHVVPAPPPPAPAPATVAPAPAPAEQKGPPKGKPGKGNGKGRGSS